MRSVPLLAVSGLEKRYGGLRAVADLSFTMGEPEILGIAGPNGAGKTTLLDVLSGVSGATSGSIRLKGREIVGLAPHRIARLGLSRTFQTPVVFSGRTILACASLAAHLSMGRRVHLPFRYRNGAVTRAQEVLDLVGLSRVGGRLVEGATLYEKKLTMLAAAVATSPDLLLLDEPAGGLNPVEVDLLLGVIRRLAQQGIGVVWVDHVMDALTSLADRMLVLHHGASLYEGSVAGMLADRTVAEVYLGRPVTSDGDAPSGGGD